MNNEISRYRQLSGSVALIWRTLLLLITITGILFILSIQQYLGFTFMQEQYVGCFLALVLAAVFIGAPAGRNASRTTVPWYDWLCSLFGFLGGMYIGIFYPNILYNFSDITPIRLMFSIITILLVLEALRRLIGWTLVIVVAVFLAYAFVAPYAPGVFQGQSTPPDILLNYLYIDSNSLLDLLNLAATIGLAFILFGQILLNFNGGDIFNNIAIRFFGKYRGGPAKAAIVGSSMVGSITGGPVANIMLTGTMTIPLMIKSGYTRAQAGAIEVVASTGGMVTPPIMGIVAFLIAENLGIPYSEVALAAVIPAVLYYLCLFVQVDLKAGQNDAGRIPKEELPSLSSVLKTSWLMVPIFFFLIYFLFFKGYTPSTTGVYSSGFALLVLLIQKDVRKDVFQRLIKAFEETGQTLLELAVILSAAGFVVGIMGITGLGFNLVLSLTQFSEYGLLVLLIASAIVSVILGMGLPGIAAYSIVAVLVVPALEELGVHVLATHLFVYYFSMVSNFTPPMAVASFAASPIAKESPHKIGFTAMRFGVMAYLLPFIFVYQPAILLGASDESGVSILIAIISATVACVLLSIGLVGYLFGNMRQVNRIILIVASILILLPVHLTGSGWLVNSIGFVVSAVVILLEWSFSKKTSLENINNLAETE